MKRRKVVYFILGIVCLIAVFGFIWAWRAYHEQRPKLTEVKAAVVISAQEIYQAFENDEDEANKDYLNKIVEVKGTVASIEQKEEQVVLVISGGADALGGVNCAIREALKLPSQGDTVNVKGRCTGFLMDVNLVDAVITK